MDPWLRPRLAHKATGRVAVERWHHARRRVAFTPGSWHKWVILIVHCLNSNSILTYVYLALHFTTGPYSGSRKEPDLFFQVNDHILPTLVVECGWSDSKGRIYDDMNLLLVGGNGSIKIVIIVKWAKLRGSRVSGTVELFMRDRNDIPILKQIEIRIFEAFSSMFYLLIAWYLYIQTVFPRPTTTNLQRLEIRRGDLFGDALLAGRNRNDILYLDVERLRDHATRSLRFMNLVPA